MRIVLTFILSFVFSQIVVLGQNRLNQYDNVGRKYGLWVYEEYGKIKAIKDYANGKPDGISIIFNDSGYIVSDTLFSHGKQVRFSNYFETDNNKILRDANNQPFTGRYYRNMTWNRVYDYTMYEEGYAHGIGTLHIDLYKSKQIHINYKGTTVYIIMCDRKLQPSTYYSFWGLGREYKINRCITNGRKLTMEFENYSDYNVLIPSLQSRTLMYVPTKGKLFHELYDIIADTLFVNLNHHHPTGRFFVEGIHGGFRYLEKKRLNFIKHRFTEKILKPQTKQTQKVKIYTHDVTITWIVLIIEEERYVFKNWKKIISQNPQVINSD